MILYVWTRYAILIHQYSQLPWQYHVFDQVMSCLHRNRQVSWQFYDLNKICNFYWVDILHFLGTLRKNRWCQLTQHAFLGQGQQKSENGQKSTHPKILWWRRFRNIFIFVPWTEPGMLCSFVVIIKFVKCLEPLTGLYMYDNCYQPL